MTAIDTCCVILALLSTVYWGCRALVAEGDDPLSFYLTLVSAALLMGVVLRPRAPQPSRDLLARSAPIALQADDGTVAGPAIVVVGVPQ